VTAPVVGIVAIGDMGRGVAVRLRGAGARVITSLAGRGRGTAARAAEAGVETAADDEALVREADLILSILPPGAAVDLAERMAAAMRRAGRAPAFVDCNAISAMTMARVAEIVAGAGAAVADVGIIGGPPDKTPGTRFYASGPELPALMTLKNLGLDLRWIGSEIGQASALKMGYGGFTKGLMALATALMVSARRAGVAEALEAELASSQGAILAALDRGLPGMPAKAYRWVAEMEEGAASFAAAGLPPELLEGAARLYEAVAATPTAQLTPVGARVPVSRARLMDDLAVEIGRVWQA